MKYQVRVTENAVAQLRESVRYISKALLSPDTARKWAARLKAEMASLETMPFRFASVEEEPWRTEGVRKMPVENFLVYYWVDETEHTVWITAVVYGRRDQLMLLKNMPLP